VDLTPPPTYEDIRDKFLEPPPKKPMTKEPPPKKPMTKESPPKNPATKEPEPKKIEPPIANNRDEILKLSLEALNKIINEITQKH
jgi:hypothetical protein